ncbi:MAG TPA: hypothetical protein VKR58_08070, partial [Aquella sp.]|nr:hypothetical protein [Aquella sp.]
MIPNIKPKTNECNTQYIFPKNVLMSIFGNFEPLDDILHLDINPDSIESKLVLLTVAKDALYPNRDHDYGMHVTLFQVHINGTGYDNHTIKKISNDVTHKF